MKTTPEIWFRFVFHIASIALETYTLRVGDGRQRCVVGITEKPCDARLCCKRVRSGEGKIWLQ